MSSELIRRSISQIQGLRGDLMRFEAAVPNALQYLEWLAGPGNAQGAINMDMLRNYCDTLCRFEKLVHRISGNFPRALWEKDETLQLLALGYVILLGDRLIPHTQAMTMLGYNNLFYVNALLYPKRGEPKLTAYYDPGVREHGRSARVDIDEVRKLVK